ncbi:hypothetical protein FBUS_06203 [Fasciolopsis buskii]|uniref:Uncharacterized protein n=1 Tax=Fasciolopsis buskii TaxID=27845 RepID=A0A8E0RKW3_9TREM|nr:hypothetical protein FBUS_06203 [Fasciolopsis buski]
MWSTLIQFADKFSCFSPQGLCYGINFCGSNASPGCLCGDGGDGDHDETTCPGRGVRLMLGGISSPLMNGTVRAWSPCSRAFALHLVLAWARRLIQLDEQAEPDSSKVRSNLARPSYGVLENWVDMILLNKLGAYASNSVQIEPDPPSFYEEPLFPISPRDQATVINTKETVIPKTQSMIQAACDEQDRITPLSVILRDPKSSLDASALAAYPTEWRALDEAWDCVIRERLTTQPYASHTVVIDLDDANEILTVERLSELVCQITQFSRRFCPGER